MKGVATKIRVLAAAVLGTMTLAAGAQTTMLNASYDVSRELYKDINPAFVASYKAASGQDVTVNQSHGGSSKQALAIASGLEADVATMNQATDLDMLVERGGHVAADWRVRFPHEATPYTTTTVFLVHKGNPKGVKDWADLAQDGLSVVIPNPKVTGNGRYTYLAAWGAADKADGGDKTKTEQFMTQFLKNVEVFDTGGRGATTTFAERGLGDVLISFESEVNNIRKQYEAQGFEVVIPKTNILAEFPVAWVDKNVQANGTEKAAKAYLTWLYSPQAQTIITDFYYRVNNPQVMDKQQDKFPQTELFRVEDKFGSWPEVMKTHFVSGGELDKLLAAGRK